jgi:hypothetical protein
MSEPALGLGTLGSLEARPAGGTEMEESALGQETCGGTGAHPSSEDTWWLGIIPHGQK